MLYTCNKYISYQFIIYRQFVYISIYFEVESCFVSQNQRPVSRRYIGGRCRHFRQKHPRLPRRKGG